ncbi:MAG: phosphoribosylglycinamide formyltransferase [Crocinitomicaceae bacterium]|nr:phosphoribosylglycinamide formyltransferase [Crocinitomicaceae bacterium]|tara:strand:- start:4750 stop:5322 length:573 start_codon:yes stop_codon:yes gene_type:complete
MKNIVIFASGGGSNAEKIMGFFAQSDVAKVTLIISNNTNAGVLQKANRFGIESHLISNDDLKSPTELIEILAEKKTDLIVLAGFLRKIHGEILRKFPNKIINIHPALLPKYGGKGMHGKHVHQAVIDHQEKESGISIHYVNENYDEGAIIYQAKCAVKKTDTADSLAARVLELEHEHFPRIINEILIGHR